MQSFRLLEEPIMLQKACPRGIHSVTLVTYIRVHFTAIVVYRKVQRRYQIACDVVGQRVQVIYISRVLFVMSFERHETRHGVQVFDIHSGGNI